MTYNEVDVQQAGDTTYTKKTNMDHKETNVVISQANHKESGTDDKTETKVVKNEPNVSTNTTDRQPTDNDIDIEDKEPVVATDSAEQVISKYNTYARHTEKWQTTIRMLPQNKSDKWLRKKRQELHTWK